MYVASIKQSFFFVVINRALKNDVGVMKRIMVTCGLRRWRGMSEMCTVYVCVCAYICVSECLCACVPVSSLRPNRERSRLIFILVHFPAVIKHPKNSIPLRQIKHKQLLY